MVEDLLEKTIPRVIANTMSKTLSLFKKIGAGVTK